MSTKANNNSNCPTGQQRQRQQRQQLRRVYQIFVTSINILLLSLIINHSTVHGFLVINNDISYQHKYTLLKIQQTYYSNRKQSSILQSLGNDYLQQLSGPPSNNNRLSLSEQQDHQQQQTHQQPVSSLPLLISSQTFTVAIADEIATNVLNICQQNTFAPMSVCIVDTCGHIIVSKRMDNCPVGAVSMAYAKALTCIQLQYSSRGYGNKYLNPTATPDAYIRLVNQLMILSQSSTLGTVAAFPGGVLVRSNSNENSNSNSNTINNSLIGAVGVSGGAGDEDEYCALQAIHTSAIGSIVTTDPLYHSCKTIK